MTVIYFIGFTTKDRCFLIKIKTSREFQTQGEFQISDRTSDKTFPREKSGHRYFVWLLNNLELLYFDKY